MTFISQINGLDISASYAITASYALNGGGSSSPTFPYTGSAIISGSLIVTGSTISTLGFTGSLFGTASYVTGSIFNSTNLALSASYALTSSYALNVEAATTATQASTIVLTVLNQTGAPISKGTVVRITGSNNASDIPRIGIADYTNDNLSANTLGLVLTTGGIANGATGSVLTEGVFLGYDTNTPGWISGQLVFLGANGTITGSAPQAPLHAVRLGQVVRAQSNNGSIYIRVDNGYELDELHDVLITSPVNGNLLIRSSSVWINSNQLTGSYGLTGSLNATSFTGSLFGTSSWADSALQALTASFVQTAQTASYFDSTINGGTF